MLSFNSSFSTFFLRSIGFGGARGDGMGGGSVLWGFWFSVPPGTGSIVLSEISGSIRGPLIVGRQFFQINLWTRFYLKQLSVSAWGYFCTRTTFHNASNGYVTAIDITPGEICDVAAFPYSE